MPAIRTTFIVLLTIPFAALSESYEIFTLDNIERVKPNVSVYDLNDGTLALKQVNALFGKNNVRTEKEAAKFITPEVKIKMQKQYHGYAKAIKYNLKYLPAVVVDAKYVIYGTTDITEYERIKK